MTQEKIFKPIPNFEDYEVNEDGVVRKISNEKVIKQTLDRDGYLTCYCNGKKRFVHRLVAQAWIPNPYNFKYVLRLDENRSNNNVYNLMWSKDQNGKLKCFESLIPEPTEEELREMFEDDQSKEDKKPEPKPELKQEPIPESKPETIEKPTVVDNNFVPIPNIKGYEINKLGVIRDIKTKYEPHLNYGYGDRFRVNIQNKDYYVHQVVARTFIPNPYNCKQIRHKDGNKHNNSVNNLEWIVSKKEMVKHHRLELDKSPILNTRSESSSPDEFKQIPMFKLRNYECNSKGIIRRTDDKFIYKQNVNTDGSLYVVIEGHKYTVHNLVAETWIKTDRSYKYVRHIDGNKYNNDVTNLVCTNLTEKEFRDSLNK